MPLPTNYISTRAFRATKGRGRLITPVAVLKQTFTNPITLDADGFSVSHAGAGAAGTTSMTLGGALCTSGVGINATPRNVVITVTHGSAVVAMSGVITGTDIYDQPQTEAWSVTAGTTSKTFTGKKAFKTITSITEVVAADASANTIVAGSGTVLGIESPLSVASLLKEVSDGSIVTNGTVVAASTATTADPRGTYSPNTAPDGTKTYVIYYLSDNPESAR